MSLDNELQIYRQQEYGLWQMNGLQSQLNCSQGVFGYPVQANIHYCYCSPPRDLHDFEIVIEQLGTMAEPRLNYGAKLRLLMADPIRGHDLREALAKLQVALREAIRD
jgi:hypothetical protein